MKKIIRVLSITAALSFAFLLGFSTLGATDRHEAYHLPSGDVQLLVPAGWLAEPDFMNVPLAVLGPAHESLPSDGEDSHETHSVILIAPLQIGIAQENISLFDGGDEEYREGRLDWLKEVGGEHPEFIASENLLLNPKLRANVRGFRYELEGENFLEKHYLMSCNQKLLYVTTLLREEHEGVDAAGIAQVVGSLQCK